VARSVRPHRQSRLARFKPLLDQQPDHLDQRRVVAHGRCPDHPDPKLLAEAGDLNVQIVDQLHVLHQEPDRHEHEAFELAGLAPRDDLLAQFLSEPRL